ncbi:hypothetical protein FHT44_005101 [Mycolicibacterium sp. BK634]|nr:hypothetical protein [Mycolicibacterium sp. BK634]
MGIVSYARGDQVTIYSGPNVVSSETGKPFRYPAVITSGPFPINTGGMGYHVLGVGKPAYPFDQHCVSDRDLEPASAPRDDLTARYEAFVARYYPNGRGRPGLYLSAYVVVFARDGIATVAAYDGLDAMRMRPNAVGAYPLSDWQANR